MKYLALAVIVLLASSTLQQTPTPPAPVASCSNADTTNPNNRALNWLIQRGVQLHSTAEKPATEICGGEFKNVGTCCKLDSLQAFTTKVFDFQANKWRSYIVKLGRVRGKFVSGFKKIAAKINLGNIKNQWSLVTQTNFSGKFPYNTILPKENNDLNALKDFVNNFDTHLAAFKTQGKMCFENLKKVRANIFCAACSLGALNYTANQTETQMRFRITEKACTTVVTSCLPIWKFNYQLVTMMQLITIIRAKAKGASAGSAFKSDLLINDVTQGIFRTIINDCSVNGTGSTAVVSCGNNGTVVQNIRSLCLNAISITQNNGLLEGDATFDEGLTDDDVNVADSEITSGARLLQSTPAPISDMSIGIQIAEPNEKAYENILADDLIVPQGSVETSTAGDNVPSSSTIVRSFFALFAGLIFSMTL